MDSIDKLMFEKLMRMFDDLQTTWRDSSGSAVYIAC